LSHRAKALEKLKRFFNHQGTKNKVRSLSALVVEEIYFNKLPNLKFLPQLAVVGAHAQFAVWRGPRVKFRRRHFHQQRTRRHIHKLIVRSM